MSLRGNTVHGETDVDILGDSCSSARLLLGLSAGLRFGGDDPFL